MYASSNLLQGFAEKPAHSDLARLCAGYSVVGVPRVALLARVHMTAIAVFVILIFGLSNRRRSLGSETHPIDGRS
jgi:hypothetical protein